MQASLQQKLARIVGKDRVLASPEDLLCYSYDGTFVSYKPDVVVKPASTEQVARVLELAYREGIPVHPRGAGTGLSGGSVPRGGGIALVMTAMNAIYEINTEDMLAVVGPGVITAELHRAVEDRGLFYPPDPGSAEVCTLGGNVAECAGGPRALKYGVTRDYILGLEVVLADGRVIHPGGRTVKNVTGYDLCRLFTGSEGTLGVITKITLRLIPKPQAVKTILAAFKDLVQTGEAVNAILSAGIIPRTLEIMDSVSIAIVEQFSPCGLPREAAAVLLIETDGEWEQAQREAGRVVAVLEEVGATEIRLAAEAREAGELWRARRAVSPAITRIKPTKISEDATVPRSQVPAMIRRLGQIREKYQIDLVIFGHAGDGNLHPNIACDRRDAGEMQRVEKAIAEIFQAALELGGTLSGEHGIGLLKAPFLMAELGEAGYQAMQDIKRSLDPKNILNPHKIFSE
ncbi:FAD-linked oxidase, C-terminal [Moorella glycerini]|uniref:FAD-linked oxidoreductase n=1 Tax=Neomoorella stamsii TaxID=1266720 RepID=A0A9X7J2R5_9FIRM|nr:MULTISPECIES: FAD-linked oxidase C-terminal domain-containing protein [Moorella]PRR72152.1 putative FAD-linked oxidoreductase [Moorella stamsii]CEP69453.1 FAD-linked oxidase, C-terminal [Moorella glycerini]